MNSNSALANDLPYWEFFAEPNPHLLLWDGSISMAAEILPIDIECFDEIRVNSLIAGLRSFMNALPEGLTGQFFVRVDSDFDEAIERHRSLVNTEVGFLREIDSDRIDKLHELTRTGAVFRPKLFFSLKGEPAQGAKGFSFSQSKKFSEDFGKFYSDRLQTVNQALEGAMVQLSGLGFESRLLTHGELERIVYDYLNPSRALTMSAPKLVESCALEGASPREQLVFGDLILDQEDFVLDQMRTRVLTLKTLPESTFAGMMGSFSTFPFKYELFLSFHIPDQTKEMKALEQKRRMAHSLANSTSNRVSDLESESKLHQTTDLIREIIETGQRVFQCELGIILRQKNDLEGRKSLNLRTKEVLARFKSLSGSEGLQETVGGWKVFRSELPFAPTNLVRMKRMKTNNIVDFLPVYGASRGDEKPVVLARTRLGSIYSLDPYSTRLSNYNQLCTGSSGSGKSFANNFLMLQQIARGTRVFIIDVGGSYKKLTNLLGGQYFEINLSDNYAINPFELSNPTEPPSGEKIKSLVSIIEQMIVDTGEKLTRLDRVQIEEVLTEVFARARSTQPVRSPVISDFARSCQQSKDENLARIGKLMFPWIGKSPYGRLLDCQGKIEANSPIVAFDLKGLSQYPDLQAVMILILTSFILDQVENDRTIPKRVLLDEAWELLKSPAAASFMEYAARTFRKTGSGITFITQGVEEIVSSGIGPAILNNTATKLIMLQKGDTRILKEVLKLNTQELALIQSLEQRKGLFSEGFLISGESRQVVRFQPSPLEYWISTSDARDNQYLQDLMSSGLTLESAVLKASQEAPYGVSIQKGMSHAA